MRRGLNEQPVVKIFVFNGLAVIGAMRIAIVPARLIISHLCVCVSARQCVDVCARR